MPKKKWFLYICLYRILHIAMKHVGKQGKSLGYKVPGKISIIGFCV